MILKENDEIHLFNVSLLYLIYGIYFQQFETLEFRPTTLRGPYSRPCRRLAHLTYICFPSTSFFKFPPIRTQSSLIENSFLFLERKNIL